MSRIRRISLVKNWYDETCRLAANISFTAETKCHLGEKFKKMYFGVLQIWHVQDLKTLDKKIIFHLILSTEIMKKYSNFS